MSETHPPSLQILVVDDEPGILGMVRAVLVRAKHEVVLRENPVDALKLMQTQPFDFVITDAMMPGMSGFDFVAALRRIPWAEKVPVLMLTKKRQIEDVKRALEAGVNDYVLKPIDADLLLDKVSLLLKKSGGGTAQGKERHVFQARLHGERSEAEIITDVRILSISESDLTVRLPFPVEENTPFRLKTTLFSDMGVDQPQLMWVSCEPAAEDVPGERELKYEARFSFLAVPEQDMKRIRSWLQKFELRKRK